MLEFWYDWREKRREKLISYIIKNRMINKNHLKKDNIRKLIRLKENTAQIRVNCYRPDKYVTLTPKYWEIDLKCLGEIL